MIRNLRRVLSILFIIIFSLYACGKNDNESKTKETETTVFEKQNNIDKTFNIAVIEYFDSEMDHSAYHGFFDYLNSNNVKYNLIFDYLANGNETNLRQQVEDLYFDESIKSKGIDLFYCIGSEAVSVVRSVFYNDSTIATNLVKPEDYIVINNKNRVKFAAVRTMPPYERQLKLLEKYKENAKNIGILYTDMEKESSYQMELAKEYLLNNNYKVKEYKINNDIKYNELASLINSEVDAVYVVADRFLLNDSKKLFEALNKENIFSIGANHYYVNNGASITLAIDYYKAGEDAGKMAYEYLVEGFPIEKLLVRDLEIFSSSVYENSNLNN